MNALLLSLVALLAPYSRVAQVVVPDAAAEALAARRPSSDRFQELDAALVALVESQPDLCERLEIGRSRGDRPIWAVRLGARARGRSGAVRQVPSVLVLPAFDVEPVVGASVALDLLVQLAQAQARWEGASHLSRSALYVVPAPDPDAWFPEDAPRRRNLDRNFPVRWDPWLAGGDSPGPYPLSEPESRALAEFALERPELGVAILLRGARRPGAAPRERASAAHPGGSFGAFLVEGLATRVLDDRDRVFREATRGLRVDAWSFSSAATALLPRLDLELGRLERLGRDLWQLDLELSNGGATGTALGDLSPASGQVRLQLEGAELVTLGSTPRHGEPGPTFELFQPGPQGPVLDPLDPGESVRLRLWLRATEGQRSSLIVRSARAGSTQVELQLR